jgi:hypothetical protein
VLSQIISNMVQFDASGRSDPDAVPIPEAAHSLMRSVIEPTAAKHSKRDVRVAAKIVGQATAAMCEDIFTVDPDWLDAVNGRNN